MTGDEADALAWAESRESGLDDRPRCDPLVFAACYLGLTLKPTPFAEPHTIGRDLIYPADESDDAIAYFVAHEAGHEIVQLACPGLDAEAEERAASRVGVALMLPRPRYLRDLSACGWDIEALRALWPLASRWILARRIAEVVSDGVVASKWTRRGCASRVVTDGIVVPARATPMESKLARAAILGEAVELGARARAWPIDGGAGGAIVVCGVEELHQQLARTTPVPPASERRRG